MRSKRVLIVLVAGAAGVIAAASAIGSSGLVSPVVVNSSGEPVIKSPNGQFSITVGNAGITLRGPSETVILTPTAVRMMVPNVDIKAVSNASMEASQGVSLRAGGTVALTGDKLWLNGCATPVARVGDSVTNPSGTYRIFSGSPSVCVG